MPIYEYLCEGCGRISEVMQKISDPPPRTCPECGSRKIAKLVSRTSFQLRGGGWYSDLYSSKKEAKPTGAATGGADKPAASSSGGTAQEKSTPTSGDAKPKPKPAAAGEATPGPKKTRSGGSTQS